MRRPSTFAHLLLLAMACDVSQAQGTKKNLEFPRFSIEHGREDSDGFPVSGAKLCLLPGKTTCFVMPSHTTSSPGGVTYDYGADPRAERWPLASGGSWVFFSSMFTAGGSGTGTRLAMLRYESDGKITNLMPYVDASNISDFAMWSLPAVSQYPVLVHADFIWSKGETHFERHYFKVEAWQFDSKTDTYQRIFEYNTKKKYGEGDSDVVRVLKGEHDEIIRRLMASISK